LPDCHTDCVDQVSNWIAAYAAVVATAVAVIQLWQFRQSQRPIGIEVSSASFETSRDGHERRIQVIVFELLNRGPHALQVADLGFQDSDGNVIYVGESSEWRSEEHT